MSKALARLIWRLDRRSSVKNTSAEPLEPRRLLATTVDFVYPPPTGNFFSNEGQPGDNFQFVLPVSRGLAGDPTSTIRVAYITSEETAIAGQDYEPQSGILKLQSGTVQNEIRIPIIADSVPEIDIGESFFTFLTKVVDVYGPPVSLAPQQAFATGNRPASPLLIDINGDGILDIVSANSGQSSLSILLNSTTPGAPIALFQPAQSVPTGAEPTDIASADLNGDGRPDLLVANRMSNSVGILLNRTGIGGELVDFFPRVDVLTGTNPQAVAIVDLNADGKPDFVTANQGQDSVSAFINRTIPGGTIAFSPRQDFAAGVNSADTDVCTGDVNGDGRPDVLVLNGGVGAFSVLLNTTTAGALLTSFGPLQDFPTASTPRGMAIGDFNGDARPDIAIANPSTQSPQDQVVVHFNRTVLGSSLIEFSDLAAAGKYAAGDDPSAVELNDLNGDGKLDLVAASAGSDEVSILINSTAPGTSIPSFESRTAAGVGNEPRGVATGDLNGDGKLDVVVANTEGLSISVCMNATVLGASDVMPAYSNNSFSSGGLLLNTTHHADVNTDGRPDLVVCNFQSVTISVLLNLTPPGAATPVFALAQDFLVGSGPAAATSADFNGDGLTDLAIANILSSSVTVLINSTPPGAQNVILTPQTFATGAGPLSIAVADMNGDDRQDIVASNVQGNTLSIFRNITESGSMGVIFAARQDVIAAAKPTHVETADFNGDGRPDIAVANEVRSVSIFLNQTAPGGNNPIALAQRVDFETADAFDARGLAVADLNNDGRVDVIVSNGGARDVPAPGVGDNGGTISVFMNATAPGSAEPLFQRIAANIDVGAGTGPLSVDAGDINGDRRPDLAITNFRSHQVTVVLNSTPAGASTAAFAAEQLKLPVGQNPLVVKLGDLNGDGRLDISSANRTSDSVSVMLNKPAVIPRESRATCIINNDDFATVSFSTAGAFADESVGQVVVNLVQSQPVPFAVPVPLSLGGTALHTIDYTVSTTEVVIPANATTASVVITVVDDTTQETTEQIALNIAPGPNPKFIPGSPAQFVLTIADNDVTSVVSAFHFLTRPHRLTFQFIANVQASLSTSDLLLQNLSDNTTIAPADMALAYDSQTNIATFTFPAIDNGILRDGYYRASIAAGDVTDPAGNPLDGNVGFEFFQYAGDANHDMIIDLTDFSALAPRFNLPGDFSQGDFNYNGVTELGDFAILASRFNQRFPLPRQTLQRATDNVSTVRPIAAVPTWPQFGERLIDQLELTEIQRVNLASNKHEHLANP